MPPTGVEQFEHRSQVRVDPLSKALDDNPLPALRGEDETVNITLLDTTVDSPVERHLLSVIGIIVRFDFHALATIADHEDAWRTQSVRRDSLQVVLADRRVLRNRQLKRVGFLGDLATGDSQLAAQ